MKRCKLVIVQALIAIVLISTSVYATLNTTIELTQTSNKVSKGEKVTVTMSLKDVDSSKKVTSVTGYINYNKDIIKEVTVDNIHKTDGKVKIGTEELPVEDLSNATIENMSSSDAYVGFNSKPSSGNDVKLVIDFGNGVTSNVDLVSIDFYVKDDATLGEVKNAISYTMSVVSSASEQSEEINKSIDLTVVQASQNNNENNNKNQNTNNQNNNNQNNNKANTNNNTNKNGTVKNTNNLTNSKDNTLAKSRLPATGSKIIIFPKVRQCLSIE